MVDVVRRTFESVADWAKLGFYRNRQSRRIYAASEHWRPVWVERYRSMRADETAFRLAQHARRRAAEEN